MYHKTPQVKVASASGYALSHQLAFESRHCNQVTILPLKPRNKECATGCNRVFLIFNLSILTDFQLSFASNSKPLNAFLTYVKTLPSPFKRFHYYLILSIYGNNFQFVKEATAKIIRVYLRLCLKPLNGNNGLKVTTNVLPSMF